MLATAAPSPLPSSPALGRRVEKSVTGATYRYIYSGVETVSVYTSTGTWKQDYVYGPGIDEVLMLEQADVLDWDGDSNTTELARSWYRSNALGSIMRIEEPDRTEAVTYRYDPYGEVTITRGGSAQGSDPLGQYVTYTGRWRDEETGLCHYRARTYDPVRGRFLQRDPLGLVDGPNVYEYAHSSPSVKVDPTGTYAALAAAALGGAKERYKSFYDSLKCLEKKWWDEHGGFTHWISCKITGECPVHSYPLRLHGPGTGFPVCPHGGYHDCPAVPPPTPVSDRDPSLKEVLEAVRRKDLVHLAELEAVGELIQVLGVVPFMSGWGQNTMHHVFGQAKHGLAGLVEQFGSREAAAAAIQKAVQEAVSAAGKTGVFKEVVKVGGTEVTAIGAVVDGVARVGTAYVKR